MKSGCTPLERFKNPGFPFFQHTLAVIPKTKAPIAPADDKLMAVNFLKKNIVNVVNKKAVTDLFIWVSKNDVHPNIIPNITPIIIPKTKAIGPEITSKV